MGVFFLLFSVVIHLQNDPSVSPCICGEKTYDTGLEATCEMQCHVQLLVKASEYLKPLGSLRVMLAKDVCHQILLTFC